MHAHAVRCDCFASRTVKTTKPPASESLGEVCVPGLRPWSASNRLLSLHHLEARTGFEPVYDGFANPHGLRVIPGSCESPRPLGDRAVAVLKAYASGRRPSDMELIALAVEAAELARLSRSEGATSA